MEIIDQIGHKLSVSKKVRRIVSLVPSQTELLVDLGLEDNLVGVTRFCTHPKHLRSTKQIIGGTKDPDLSLIKSLEPDLIICNKEENRKEDVEFFQSKYPTYTSDIIYFEDALNMINDVGSLLNCGIKASELVKEIQVGFNKLEKTRLKTVAYIIWDNPIMVVNNNTFIDSMLTKIGLHNVFSKSKNRYSTITKEELSNTNPNYIFLSSEPFPFKEKNKKNFQNQYPNSKIILVDGRMFSWYGSCLKSAPLYLNSLYKILKD
ncbi:MAG: ABC transporter substrate-binding protein [Salibacteraceae bacterium]